ncbi:MAG: MFS transporter, partial [Actinomycetota bacterium]|nr:MFS transporter [Actinomycetota bacterium]
PSPPAQTRSAAEDARRLKRLLVRRPELRSYLVANALWELSLGALKTFVVLYLTVGLGLSLVQSTLVVGGVAVFVLVVAAVSGPLADRYGRIRVMQWASLLYGGGLLVPFLVTWQPAIAVAVPLIAIGAGVVMSLPYALLIPMMADDERGALTGFYSFSRGIGTAAGPLLAGAAISLTSGTFGATHGYQATWGVCCVAVLLSVVALRRLRHTAAATTARG